MITMNAFTEKLIKVSLTECDFLSISINWKISKASIAKETNQPYSLVGV
jgi:hypothetical protein